MIAIYTIFRDFPGGPVVENLPSNAGDAGLIPGRGTKISHAGWATKLACYNLWVYALQLEKNPRAAMKTQHSRKQKTRQWLEVILTRRV